MLLIVLSSSSCKICEAISYIAYPLGMTAECSFFFYIFIERFWWHIGWYYHLSPFACVRTFILSKIRLVMKVWWFQRARAHFRCVRVLFLCPSQWGMVWDACSSIQTELNLFQTHQTKNVCVYAKRLNILENFSWAKAFFFCIVLWCAPSIKLIWMLYVHCTMYLDGYRFFS